MNKKDEWLDDQVAAESEVEDDVDGVDDLDDVDGGDADELESEDAEPDGLESDDDDLDDDADGDQSEDGDESDEDSRHSGSAAADPASRLKQLEEEGDIAADYLEDLLDIVDMDGDIDIDVENNRASVAIVAEDTHVLQRLVGNDGQVLDALQELTRLAVQTETGERSRLMLDVADFRANRKAQLRQIALEAIARLRATGEPQALEPMNPFERKVCHDVAAEQGLASESAGNEPHRHVVISFPADEDFDDADPGDDDATDDLDDGQDQ